MPTQAAVQEKEKVSLMLDKPVVEGIHVLFGRRALSTSINELLCAALAQERLGELVDEMDQEAGTPSPEAYECWRQPGCPSESGAQDATGHADVRIRVVGMMA